MASVLWIQMFFSLFMELSDDLVVQLNDIYVLYYVLSATASG